MYAALTVRRLKPGSYEQWRAAWEPEEWPKGLRAYILRSVNDPDEVIAFGLIEGGREEAEAARPDPDAERRRQGRMAPYVLSTGADGFYEVVERLP